MVTNSAFKDSFDIANRAAAACGVRKITAADTSTRNYQILADAYNPRRQAELRRNLWVFAKRKAYLRPIDANTRRLDPQDWDASAMYLPGSIVKGDNGDIFVSYVTENQGNDPAASDAWESYFGPMSVSLWSSSATYQAGELVYKLVDGAAFVVYMSQANGNSTTPSTSTAWSATVTYGLDDVISYSGSMWRSVIPLNLNNTPVDAPDDWAANVTYNMSDTATGADGYVYTSVGNGNIGNEPTLDDGTLWTKGVPYAWSRIPTIQTSDTSWLPIYADLKPMGIEWLQIDGLDGRNVYLKPAGFLRETLIDPKHVRMPSDHEDYGDEFILSADNPLSIAFIADITKVKRMDAMFCEMLGLSIAEFTCQPLTQSHEKLSDITSLYARFAFEARQVNAIEEEYSEPDEDNYITVRR